MDTNDDFSICEIHVDQLYRSSPGDIYRIMFDDDGDHQHYHDHRDVYGVYQHDHDHVRRYLKNSFDFMPVKITSTYHVIWFSWVSYLILSFELNHVRPFFIFFYFNLET